MNQWHPDYNKIEYSCGYCGMPLNGDREPIAPCEGYSPDNYPRQACPECLAEGERERYLWEMFDPMEGGT